jgi:redox-sensitive bicupin YhaK (pirin superfamily)
MRQTTYVMVIMGNRKIHKITRGSGQHWVGDGFPVNSMFSYNSDAGISPFLLLDHAGPADFEPVSEPRGVGQHPHRGFETVTIVYDGEIEHKDTAGNSGKIGPGDVQWMTAARGIIHEEKHSHNFTRNGGRMEMVQLWVNLPAKYKMSPPRYQGILSKDIPVVTLPGGAGTVRVIAGEFAGIKGAAQTFSPVHLYDVRLKTGSAAEIPVTGGFNALLLVLKGRLHIADDIIHASELAFFETEGNSVSVQAETDTSLLFMSGEPINEPVVGAGPFVMNTEEEIHKAFSDFRSGRI